jgi:hypothetical protein
MNITRKKRKKERNGGLRRGIERERGRKIARKKRKKEKEFGWRNHFKPIIKLKICPILKR